MQTSIVQMQKGKKMDDLISRRDVIALAKDVVLENGCLHRCIDATQIWELPSAQKTGKWNNHEVAMILADLFGDTCACNFCGIDEWLPQECELIDSCPNTIGVACWEQFLTHRYKRKNNE